MKNFWSIFESHGVFEYNFILQEHQYDVKILISLLNLVVSSGKKYDVFNILNAFNKTDLSSKFIEHSVNYIMEYENRGISIKEKFIGGDFFVGISTIMYEGLFLEDYKEEEILFQSHCKLAYYDKNDRIEIDNIFNVDIFYKLLNPYRVHLYHKNKTGTSAPIEVELSISNGKALNLRVASGLGLWLPYYKPDYDMDKQSLKDFPINEFGYIDNRELYLLNTPRLIGFIKDLRRFFEIHNGKERSNNAQLEKFPEFPWYK